MTSQLAMLFSASVHAAPVCPAGDFHSATTTWHGSRSIPTMSIKSRALAPSFQENHTLTRHTQLQASLPYQPNMTTPQRLETVRRMQTAIGTAYTTLGAW
jgi:hypothetical protein